MNREEAIEWVKRICAYLTSGNPIWRNEPIIDACNIAIEALKQPEREHSEWELKTFDDGYGEYQLYVCKRCGGVTAQRRNFCNDCGADMRPIGG